METEQSDSLSVCQCVSVSVVTQNLNSLTSIITSSRACRESGVWSLESEHVRRPDIISELGVEVPRLTYLTYLASQLARIQNTKCPEPDYLSSYHPIILSYSTRYQMWVAIFFFP